MTSVPSVTSPKPNIITIESDLNEPTILYVFIWHLPIIPSYLNDLNLLPNPFNILAEMAVVEPGTPLRHDEEHSPQSPEASDPSPKSTLPMNLSTIEGCDTSYASSNANNFYSDDDPQRIYFLSSPSPLLPPH